MFPIKKLYMASAFQALLYAYTINGYTITVTNDSDCLILVEAESATYKGLADLVDSGETRVLDFGASCPWLIRVSNFLNAAGKKPLPVELHYGDNPAEQCINKKLKVTANPNDWKTVTKLSVHTDIIAHDGTRGVDGWKNDWSSPENARVFQPSAPAIMQGPPATYATVHIKNNNRNGFNAHIKYNQRSQEKTVHIAPGETKSVEIQGSGIVAVDGIFYNFDDDPGRSYGSYANCPLTTSVYQKNEVQCHVDYFGSLIIG